MESRMKDLENEREGGGRYVASCIGFRGKGLGGVSLRSHVVVATQVALKRAAAFSSFEMQ